MREMISLPVTKDIISEYRDLDELERWVRALGCDGTELIWGGENSLKKAPCPDCVGYHLIFYQDWLDFWRGNEKKLIEKFGSSEAIRKFYGGESRESMIRQYREDLDRAAALNAKYVVFHVSDVSIEEGYSYCWQHSDTEVIDAAIELINTVTCCSDYSFTILVENQWWPGFTFTSPPMTERLLDGIRSSAKGIMLDTGHLMNTCVSLESEKQGIDYIHKMLDEHSSLSNYIYGVHLHKSLSGQYVRENTAYLPANLLTDYFERFKESYAHILSIDRHEPWSCRDISGLISRINPKYLVHELAASCRSERELAVKKQKAALWAETQCFNTAKTEFS